MGILVMILAYGAYRFLSSKIIFFQQFLIDQSVIHKANSKLRNEDKL